MISMIWHRRISTIFECVRIVRQIPVSNMGGDWPGLFISIVASAVGDVEPPVFHMVDEPVFFVDAAAVFALQVTGEGFGFSDPMHTAVPLDIYDELVDSL